MSTRQRVVAESTTTPVPVLRVSTDVLDQARIFFERCGVRGCEGTALIAGTVTGADMLGDTLVIPDQVASPVPYASVTVTPAGDLHLATAIEPHQRYLARIHSHPGEAFHSRTDDANPALTHEGAFSIVVPYFGLGLRVGLDACAIFVRADHQWVDLPAGSSRRAKQVHTDD